MESECSMKSLETGEKVEESRSSKSTSMAVEWEGTLETAP